MDGPSRVRWERVLLVLAALVGIVAMHSMVGPSHHEAMPAPSVVPVASPVDPGGPAHIAISAPAIGGHVATAMNSAAGPGDGPMSPTSMPHALMHLCLAVMAVGVVLGLLAVAWLVAVMPHRRSYGSRAPRTDARPARPPLPTGTRLAQLCVLRN